MLKIRKIKEGRSLTELPMQEIACNNWAAEYPYAPRVRFAAGHDGERLLLRFEVEEACTAAKVTEDNGPVWTDSAVEFFISFDETGYYNFEFNCIGRALLGFRKTKPDVRHADGRIMGLIVRRPSLGGEPFGERRGDNRWTLEAEIPAAAFFAHDFGTLDGLRARANVYKCGDDLSQPHFLSWQPIGTEKPNFHVPEYFGEVEFEG